MSNQELMALKPAFERLEVKGLLTEKEVAFLRGEGILEKKGEVV